jgi:hypothetical protein
MRTALRASAGAAFSLVLLIALAVLVKDAWNWPFAAKLFPLVIGLPALVLCAIQLAGDTSSTIAARRLTPGIEARLESTASRAALTWCWIVGFFVGIWLVGFVVSVPIFVTLYVVSTARTSWPVGFAFGGLTSAFMLAVFHFLLRLHWPTPLFSSLQDAILGWL